MKRKTISWNICKIIYIVNNKKNTRDFPILEKEKNSYVNAENLKANTIENKSKCDAIFMIELKHEYSLLRINKKKSTKIISISFILNLGLLYFIVTDLCKKSMMLHTTSEYSKINLIKNIIFVKTNET